MRNKYEIAQIRIQRIRNQQRVVVLYLQVVGKTQPLEESIVSYLKEIIDEMKHQDRRKKVKESADGELSANERKKKCEWQ